MIKVTRSIHDESLFLPHSALFLSRTLSHSPLSLDVRLPSRYLPITYNT